ncbi:reverse transcriptase, partial [Globisporangium splendens]
MGEDRNHSWSRPRNLDHQCEQGEMAQLSLRRKYSVEYKAHQRIPAMDYRCDHINPQPKLVVTTTDSEGANVMGFSKSDANLNSWFSHFRQTDDSGSLDIVFLQETHVMETEVASMQSRFRRSWGFQEPSEESDPRLSLWSASTERKGGVAILLNPYSCITTLAPYKQDQWNAHWMAATVTLRGETVLLLNIYAPSTVFAREVFYRALSGLLSSHDGLILCGGDFNCTLNQTADRSHNNHNKVHDSRELKKLLQKLNLVDTLEDDTLRATDTRDVKAFHRQHHTYYYTLPSGDSASSRLDRWYCSNDHLDWVRSVYQSVAGPFSDHNGVTIRVAAPDKVIQSKKPRVVYPLPRSAAAHAAIIGKDIFEKAHDQLDELRGRYSSPRDYALATTNWWDEAKIALRIRYLEAKKSYFARLNQGYKKKIQRLQRRLSESEVQMLDHSGGAVSDHNVELSQEFLTTATSIRRAIAECKSKWQASKRDRIFREHMHHERKTSKSFYKRISTKLLDNTIFTLGGTATYGPMRSRELADDMGEGWKSIMQQAPTLQTDIDQILDPGTAIPPSDRLGFLLKPINSSEIKQAVKKCKRGKAHGPDELGNDWYRDHCDEITGLFERLFNLWIPECILPSSFSEAHIHCIKKSVSAASPLDYRPIALLNSDYKIFTRIFATRLRTVLPWLIHHMQAGFVPGRAIPTTIDVLLAAQQRATSDPAVSRAIALLLDFAKAYDSLDRSFLAQALQHLGFPLNSTEESVSDIHVLQREEHCRYLGIQVGQTPSNAINWSKCIQALRVRLRLVRLKTHSVAQRAAIASAAIIPKVLYVARHSWPSTAIVNQLHDLVKQFVWGSRNGKPAKPWMKDEQAELKKMNGGLSVPNIRTELMTVSATAVSKWAITTSHIDQVIGEILLHNTRASSTYITPLDAIPRRPPQLRGDMWTTGAALCASLHSRPYEPRERDNVRWCYERFKSTIVQTQWDGDVFQIDLSSKMSDRLPGIIAEGRRLRGTFCAEWLPYMTSTADGWLLDSNGSPYKLAHSPLSVGTAQLGDILRWEWIRPGVLNFISACGISGFSRPSIRALERLCATLVSNFPQLLYRPQQTNVLRLYNGQRHYNHEWHLHTSEATLTHVDTTPVKAMHTVHSATDCDIMATRDLNGQKVSFHAHPRFTRIVQLWGGNGRYNTTRSFYRQQVAATRTQIGKDTRDAAVNKAVQTAGSLWPGLQLIQWSELHNIPGITVYTAQTLLRLKANRLSMWNYEKADLSCSNPECSQVVQSSVQHLFWECPKAKLVWNYFYALWAKIGITPGHDPAIWIIIQRGIQGTSTYSGDGLPLRPYQPTTQARDDNHLPRRRSATVNARHELTVGFHTQNVMGFSKSDANLNAWFSHFRQTDDSGSLDIVFLQETHVMETEVASMQSRFRRSWGFQEPSEESDPRLSLWSASTERKGGVAILLNPYSCIPTLTPYKQDQWNAHWMAATVTLRGETVLLLNIYAPSTVFAREVFYRALSGLLSSHDGLILCGGDFNCTLNQTADRSHNNHNKVHDSRELKKLLQKLNLVDTLEDDTLRATDTRDVKAFHRQHHTYYYTLPSGDSASSRLDRWYCSNDHLDWVRSVYQSVAGPFSDHNGVTIRVAAPDKVIQSKKPRVVYPLPRSAAAHAAIIGKDIFEKAHDQLDELRGRYSSPRDYALATTNWWDEAKIALRIRYLEAKKSYFARLNQGYKKKIQRLQRRLSESEAQMLDHSGGAVGDQNVELSQEFLTTATSIRRAIAECKSKWQASKRDRIFREHMHHERKTSKSFYKRISTKFLDNTIFALGGTATYGPRRSRELADDMGEGWKSIMQQAPTLQTDIDQILDPGTAIPPSDRLGFLLKPINSSEIKQAVKKCKRGKAHGPDELGNDWYRDHCDEITGLFERLFNLWIPECILPSSFSEAHIHCIKKSVSAASPLDYRPIALLNSDYKIFTRIFATRLRTVLPWLIHHMQAGFVPGRAIPTTIDVLLAAQQRAMSDPAMSRAIALLLDFAKAYDSLDRSFLAQALQHLGFPLKFVHLVKVLHSQTTYKFIVNGFLSRKYNVTSGIRQGYPLAPLLFILALEVLYRKIEESDEIHGVELQAAGCATEDINAVFAILDKYGAASGLRVNRHKSAVLPLNKEYSSTEESVSDIHVLQREEHCRYLGIQVGQTPSNASNWSKCIQPLRVRLRLARLKTHSVAQRAAIASAVIIPKVLYVARHSWPSTAIVNQLHGLVKQFVWGSRNGKPAKPWMKEEQAELKKMNGGLSVPNIRTELMTMSATAVSKWAITTSHIDQVIGEILLHNTRTSSTYITPLDAIPRRPPQLRDNMWTTGAALCASLHSRPYEPRERDNVRWCYEHFKSTIVQTQWDGDVFQIDLSSKMSDRLPGIIAEGRKLRGTFCAEWLPYMTSTADGWLLDSNGSPYKLAHTSLSVGTAQLGDILRWEWIRPGVLNFISACGISGFSRPSIRALERLCATLVSNFPQLLYRPQQTNVLRLYNGQRHYNHEWHLHTSEATLTHVDTTLVKATHTVHSAMDCDIMTTRDLNGQKVSFHAHPRFTRIVQLWGGNGRYNTTRSFYRQQVAATRTQIGKDTRDAAVNKAVQTAGSLWPGLQLIQWSELHNIPGITVYTEKADLSCSNPECSQVVQSSVQHLFWECPKAKLVWNYFYALWAKIGITPGHDPAIWIFSLDLPHTPRHAWTTIKRHIIGHKFSNEHLQDHLYPVAHMLWRYMSASLIQAIWCAHLRRMDSDPIESTAEMAIMMTRLEAGMRNLTRLAEAQAGDSDGHTVAAVLKAYVDCFLSQTDATPLTPSDTRGVYLLFFDGGSRGNLGPGGTGSIIVRVHKDSHTASLIWAASMAYSRKDTTNNFAEYWGQ